VCILWWEESEIFWVVGGKWSILVCGRKVGILWWEESEIFWVVGVKCDMLVCVRKV